MELLIDQSRKRPVQNLWDDRMARLPVLQAGSAEPLSVGIVDSIRFPFDARLFTPQDLTGLTIRAALGIGFILPVDGTFMLTFTANDETTETTDQISYDPGAYEIDAALNALAKVIAIGGITVTGEDGFFRLTFNENGVREHLLSGDAGSLVPISLLDIQQAVEGDSTTQEVQTLRIVQSASALATLATASVSAGIAVVTVQAGSAGNNHQVRVTITGDIYKGTWTFSTSAGESAPIGYDDSPAQIENAIEAISGVGANNVQVDQEDVGTFLVTFIGTLAGTAIAGITVDGTNLVAISEKSGTLDLGTAAVAMLLNGSTERVVTLEIESQLGAALPKKLLRHDVLLTRPVMEPAMTAPPPGAGSATIETIESYVGSSPLITVAAAGITDLAPATPFHQWTQRIIAQAGVGAYTHKFTLDNLEAINGAEYTLIIELPTSANPTVQVFDNTIGGTQLQAVTGSAHEALTFIFKAYFYGTNWKKKSAYYSS